MLLGPDEIAWRIQHQHQPGWVVWYGKATGLYWALASWVPTLDGFVGAPAPETLDAAIATVEMLHPKPAHHHAHALSEAAGARWPVGIV
jgi:hypothetical protein